MKTKKILLNALPLLFVGGAMVAFAAAPTGGYLPNATLDPDCAPLDTDCFVRIAVDQDPWFGTDDNAVATDNSEDVYVIGKVGIGTATPQVRLQLMPDADVAVAGWWVLVIGDTTWANMGFDSNEIMARNNGAPSDLFIQNGSGHTYLNYVSWNVGIGLAATPSEKLHVAGNILASGTITPSDRKLKDNIVEIENALDKVNSIGGYTYTLKATGEEKAGVIAQEIEAVLPEAVNTYEDFKAVEYDMLNALLIEAVQELSAKVAELEAAQ